jgi:hypothetical protein
LKLKQRERLVTAIFLFLISVQLAHFVHSGWFFYEQGQLAPNHVTPPPQYADLYRVAIPTLVRMVRQVLHFNDGPTILAVLDLVTGFFGLYLLYLLTVDLPAQEPDRPKDRALKILILLAIIQIPITWVVPLQRPETMPSTLFLAFSLCCLTKRKSHPLWSLPILAATVVEAFARTDVPLVFGIALALVGLWTLVKPVPDASSSLVRAYILIGALITLISAGIQARLSYLHPHLSLDIQLKQNLTLHGLQILAISLSPYALFFLFLIVRRPALNILERVVILAALLYLPIYFTFGVVAEVRIYVPFMLIMSMVVARVWGSYLIEQFDAAR